MANYEYSSYSSSSSGNVGGAGGNAAAAFNQADTNQDGVLSQGEFSNFLNSAGGVGVGGAGNFGSSSYESSSSSFSSTGGVDSFGAGGFSAGGAEGFSVGGAVGAGGFGGASSFESSSFESSSSSSGGVDLAAVSQAAGYTAQTNAAWSKYGAEVRAPGLYVDANPQIITRQAPGGVQTYTQNIRVRFLQPPAVPPPGVSYSLFDVNLISNNLISSFSHSSSKKSDHLSHHHHHHSVSNNKLHLSHNHPHSFSVNDHHNHQLQLLHKLLFVNSLLSLFHHVQSSLNVYQLLHQNHVSILLFYFHS